MHHTVALVRADDAPIRLRSPGAPVDALALGTLQHGIRAHLSLLSALLGLENQDQDDDCPDHANRKLLCPFHCLPLS